MREKLANMGGTEMFKARVTRRRKTARIGGRIVDQRVVVDVRNMNNELVTDHLVLTIGREIKPIPIVYSRIVPGCEIQFVGRASKYTRANGTEDYTLFIEKLVDSKVIQNGA